MIIKIYYGGVPNRVDAYVSGERVAAANSAAAVTDASPHGTSFHDGDSTCLTVLLKGSAPVDLYVAPVVTLTAGLAVTMTEFFATGKDGLVANIALLLGIDPSRIRVPSAAAVTRLARTELKRAVGPTVRCRISRVPLLERPRTLGRVSSARAEVFGGAECVGLRTVDAGGI